MQMAAARLIQAFPPGMTVPPDERPVAPSPSREVRETVVSVSQRRRQVIAELARLKTHSHRRAALLGRLRELTLAELREGLR